MRYTITLSRCATCLIIYLYTSTCSNICTRWCITETDILCRANGYPITRSRYIAPVYFQIHRATPTLPACILYLSCVSISSPRSQSRCTKTLSAVQNQTKRYGCSININSRWICITTLWHTITLTYTTCLIIYLYTPTCTYV